MNIAVGVNKYRDLDFDIDVTRTGYKDGKWGNPFVVNDNCTREESIQQHRDYLLTNHFLTKDILELSGKKLGCVCLPKACHSETLAEFANECIFLFRDEFRFLSNFHFAKIKYKYGIEYKTTEHLFQCMKTKKAREFKKILDAESPGLAKYLGGVCELRDGWEDKKINVMRTCLALKFLQHPDLAELLLATGDKILVEGNYHGDAYWGWDLKKGYGLNMLGWLLMETRTALKNGTLEVEF